MGPRHAQARRECPPSPRGRPGGTKGGDGPPFVREWGQKKSRVQAARAPSSVGAPRGGPRGRGQAPRVRGSRPAPLRPGPRAHPTSRGPRPSPRKAAAEAPPARGRGFRTGRGPRPGRTDPGAASDPGTGTCGPGAPAFPPPWGGKREGGASARVGTYGRPQPPGPGLPSPVPMGHGRVRRGGGRGGPGRTRGGAEGSEGESFTEGRSHQAPTP